VEDASEDFFSGTAVVELVFGAKLERELARAVEPVIRLDMPLALAFVFSSPDVWLALPASWSETDAFDVAVNRREVEVAVDGAARVGGLLMLLPRADERAPAPTFPALELKVDVFEAAGAIPRLGGAVAGVSPRLVGPVAEDLAAAGDDGAEGLEGVGASVGSASGAGASAGGADGGSGVTISVSAMLMVGARLIGKRSLVYRSGTLKGGLEDIGTEDRSPAPRAKVKGNEHEVRDNAETVQGRTRKNCCIGPDDLSLVEERKASWTATRSQGKSAGTLLQLSPDTTPRSSKRLGQLSRMGPSASASAGLSRKW
jgi:hypothetical protein